RSAEETHGGTCEQGLWLLHTYRSKGGPSTILRYHWRQHLSKQRTDSRVPLRVQPSRSDAFIASRSTKPTRKLRLFRSSERYPLPAPQQRIHSKIPGEESRFRVH